MSEEIEKQRNEKLKLVAELLGECQAMGVEAGLPPIIYLVTMNGENLASNVDLGWDASADNGWQTSTEYCS